MKKLLKRILVNFPIFIKITIFFTKNINPRVFVYHRFSHNPDNYQDRIDEDTFEWQLSKIDQHFNVVSLEEYLNIVYTKHSIPRNLAIITVDDGYYDFYKIAYPLLKKFKIRATLFPVVNFIERKIWLWPDRIHYAIENTGKKTCQFSFEDQFFNLDFSSKEKQFLSFKELSDYSISIKNRKKWKFISNIEKLLKVNPPDVPPENFSSVTWEQLKEMSENGIEIGSHTMNHPILSRISLNELHDEIFQSKKMLEKKLNREVVSFCYPNSYPADINEKVIELVKSAEYKGAVFYTLPGYNDIFRIPRIFAENDEVNFLWQLSGMEYLIGRARHHYNKFRH